MRKLWEEHITYTRNYIISALAGLPDSDAVAQRLLSNQDDIGNAIKPYYRDAAGKRTNRNSKRISRCASSRKPVFCKIRR